MKETVLLSIYTMRVHNRNVSLRHFFLVPTMYIMIGINGTK